VEDGQPGKPTPHLQQPHRHFETSELVVELAELGITGLKITQSLCQFFLLLGEFLLRFVVERIADIASVASPARDNNRQQRAKRAVDGLNRVIDSHAKSIGRKLESHNRALCVGETANRQVNSLYCGKRGETSLPV